jgi:hypothetical protein
MYAARLSDYIIIRTGLSIKIHHSQIMNNLTFYEQFNFQEVKINSTQDLLKPKDNLVANSYVPKDR